MKNLTEQLAKWMTPGDAKALLNTFTTGLGFQAVVPLGEHGVRLSLWLQKGQEEQVIIPDTSECPQSVAALILSRLGSPAVGDREQDHPAVEVELIGDIVCGECGTANHSSSLLCRRCGNGLVEQVSRSQVTQEEVLVLLHLLVARTQAESGEPERGLEVLESQLDSLPPHQPKIRGLGDSVAETVFDDIPVLLRKICNPPFRLINGILNTPGTLKENLLFRNWDEFNGHPRSPPLSRPDAP